MSITQVLGEEGSSQMNEQYVMDNRDHGSPWKVWNLREMMEESDANNVFLKYRDVVKT